MGSTRVHGQTMVGKLILQKDMVLDGGNIDLCSVLSSASSFDYAGTVMTVNVDSSQSAFGKPLTINSNFDYVLTDATSGGNMPCRAIALENSTGSKKVLLVGMIYNDSWSWENGPVFISTQTGELIQPAPSGSGTQIQKVGHALSQKTLMIEIDNTIVQI